VASAVWDAGTPVLIVYKGTVENRCQTSCPLGWGTVDISAQGCGGVRTDYFWEEMGCGSSLIRLSLEEKREVLWERCWEGRGYRRGDKLSIKEKVPGWKCVFTNANLKRGRGEGETRDERVPTAVSPSASVED